MPFRTAQNDDLRTYLYGCPADPDHGEQLLRAELPRLPRPRLRPRHRRRQQSAPPGRPQHAVPGGTRLWIRDLPVIPRCRRPNIAIARSALRNFRNAPTSTPMTVNAWEWELPKPLRRRPVIGSWRR